MTARLVFEATLIELSKTQAPQLKLYEFNYLFNKAINQYINKVYNVYDINQLTTDDLRVLKATAFLTPQKVDGNKIGESTSALKNGIRIFKYANANKTEFSNNKKESGELVNPVSGTLLSTTTTENGSTSYQVRTTDGAKASSYLSLAHSSIQSLRGANYEVFMPIDYLHMLNCVCIYYVAKQKDCWDAGSYIEVPAIRLTADSWSQIVTDIYNRPSPMRPYYYIHNENLYESVPTNPYTSSTGSTSGKDLIGTGTDMSGIYKVTSSEGGTTLTSSLIADEYPGVNEPDQTSNFQRTFKLGGEDGPTVSLVEKPTAMRFGNTSNVRCEIRYGKDDSLFQLAEVQIDYVKCPQFIRLTQEQIDLTEDTSQIMEFPDYVNQEIINELVHLVMERVSDPRLANNILMTLSIARPTGQLQQQPQLAQ